MENRLKSAFRKKINSASVARIKCLHSIRESHIIYIECKSSQTAPLTLNQKVGYHEIEASGAVITGSVKSGFGGRIPPTKIEIVRPNIDKDK